MYVILNVKLIWGQLDPKVEQTHKTPTKEIENTFLGSWEM